ncbi:MAG: sensor histidine kinase [Bacteroidia bacterium]|nr:sensor histidine kinase [Bacteroidia bacterium]
MHHITDKNRLVFFTGMAGFFLLCLTFSLYSQPQKQAPAPCWDLLSVEKANADSVDEWNRCVVARINQHNYTEGDSLAVALIAISEKISYPVGVARQYNNLGRIRRHQGKHDEALTFYKKGLAYRKKNNLIDSGIGYTLQEIGFNYGDMGNYAKAIEAHLDAIPYFEKENKHKALCEEYNNIGTANSNFGYQMFKIDSTFDRIPAFQEAIRYYKKAYQKAYEKSLWESYINVAGNLGRDYLEIGKTDSAAYFLDKGIAVCDSVLDTLHNEKNRMKLLKLKADINGKKGHLRETQKQYEQALALHTESLRLYEEVKSETGKFTALTNIGNNYEQQGDLKKRLKYYLQAYEIGKTAGISERQKLLMNKNLYQTYFDLKDTLSAYPFLLAANLVEQETAAKEISQNIKFVQVNATLTADIEIAKAQTQLRTWMLGGSGIALILLMVGILQQLRLRKAQKKEDEWKISQKELAYEAQINSIIEDSRQKLVAKQNETQEIVLKKIGRELHDNIAGTLVTCKRMLESWIEVSNHPEYGQKTENILRNVIDDVRQLSHNLEAVTLKNGLIPGIQELCYKINEVYKQPEIKLQTHNLKTLNLPANWEINIYRIFQEALTNIMKYSQAQNVEIQIYVREDILSLTIEDDGKGFNSEEKAAGIGLLNMRSRAEEMGGTFTISSVIDHGTTLFIEIPLFPQTS